MVPPTRSSVVDHDEAVARLRKICRELDVRRVADAFVSTFDVYDPVLAGGLMCWVQGANMPEHPATGTKSRPNLCRVCGLESQRSDFAEDCLDARSGGGIPSSLSNPLTLTAALEQFAAAPVAKPSKRAIAQFVALLSVIRSAPPTAGESKLRAALGKAGVLGNARERQAALETLGTIGVLATAEHRGFFRNHVDYWARQDRPGPRVEVDPPLCFWRAADGVHRDAFTHYFGQLGLDPELLRAPAPKAPSRAAPKPTPATELEVGDVFAFVCPDGGWRAGIVLGFLPSKSAGPGPIFRFYSPRLEREPELETLSSLALLPVEIALYGMRKRSHRKLDPRYRHLGTSAAPERGSGGCTIGNLKDLDRALAQVAEVDSRSGS